MKAAAALDAFANVTHGFAALLTGDCFEDVFITTVNVSQKSNPTYRRASNSDTSTTRYSDHFKLATEVVPSAVDMVTGGTGSYAWIVIFIMIVILSTMVCACLGVRCIQSGYYYRTAVSCANEREEDLQDDRVKRVDGSALDTPTSYSKKNRMFSSPTSDGSGRRMTAREKRVALNARNAPGLRGNATDKMDDFEVLSAASALSSTNDSTESVQEINPMFLNRGGHAPRLSMLDFGKTLDQDNGDESETAAEFWRRRNRIGDGDT